MWNHEKNNHGSYADCIEIQETVHADYRPRPTRLFSCAKIVRQRAEKQPHVKRRMDETQPSFNLLKHLGELKELRSSSLLWISPARNFAFEAVSKGMKIGGVAIIRNKSRIEEQNFNLQFLLVPPSMPLPPNRQEQRKRTSFVRTFYKEMPNTRVCQRQSMSSTGLECKNATALNVMKRNIAKNASLRIQVVKRVRQRHAELSNKHRLGVQRLQGITPVVSSSNIAIIVSMLQEGWTQHLPCDSSSRRAVRHYPCRS
jgi:hypothetical protein